MHGRVHGTYTAVHTDRKDETAVYRTRPMHGHVYGRYTVGYGPRIRPCFATYRLRTRPCTVNTAVFTARVHGIVRTVYTAVHGVYG